jgi:hypothetical protein
VAYLRISEARAAATIVREPPRKSADQLLTEEARSFSNQNRYDIFLSHAYNNGELILGVKKLIEDRASPSTWTGSTTRSSTAAG